MFKGIQTNVRGLFIGPSPARKLIIPGDLIFWSYPEGAKPLERHVKFINLYKSKPKSCDAAAKTCFHVSMLAKANNDDWIMSEIIHSTPAGVKLETMKQYVHRWPEKPVPFLITYAKVNATTDEQKNLAKDFALSKVGCRFANMYTLEYVNTRNAEAYYCSSLLKAAYDAVVAGLKFPSEPFNFRDETGELDPFWMEHFQRIRCRVPETELNIHPTLMMENCDVTTVIGSEILSFD